MPTPHEELFTLKEEVNDAKEEYEWAEHKYQTKFWGGRKLWLEAERLKAEHKKLRKAYMARLLVVLHENHGVLPKNVVKSEGMTRKKHRLEVLVGKHIHEITATVIGERIVFFVGDEALDENEKVEDLLAKRTKESD